jgi:ADP-ribosylation factor-like protein 6
MVGLNNSGKSTILCNLNLDMLEYARDMENIEQVSTCPTSGVSLVEFEKERVKWRVWELSGQGRFRNMWTYYSGHVQAIVYVVDVTDGDRIATARDELQALLDQPRVKEKRLPVLIFANKQDLGNGDDDANDGGKKALSIDNVRMAFGVESLQQKHKVKVLATSALTGTGVAEGFVWLNDVLYHQSKGEDLIE